MRRPLPVYRFFQADKNKAAAEEEAAEGAEQVAVGGVRSQRDEECRLSENVQNGIFFFANHSERKELETQTAAAAAAQQMVSEGGNIHSRPTTTPPPFPPLPIWLCLCVRIIHLKDAKVAAAQCAAPKQPKQQQQPQQR